MPRKKSTAFYRVLLRDALHLTWNRKSLWIFGMFTAIISTGGVFDVAGRSFMRVQSGPKLFQSLLDGSFVGFRLLSEYVRRLQIADPGRASFTIGMLVVLGLILLIAAVLSQGALIKGILEKKPLALKPLLQKGGPYFWHLAGIDALTEIATGFVVILTTYVVLLAIAQTSLIHVLIYLGTFLLFFPLILAINIIGTLAAIDSVRHETHALDAIHHAVNIFRTHWLVTIELGILLFLLVFGVAVLEFVALIFLSIPFTILSVLALFSSIPFLFILVNVLTVAVFAGLILAFAGAAVTFQYAVWAHFYSAAHKKSLLKRIQPKLHRLWWA